ncbi:MAG: TonB-dependent receptor [Rikenellaceae bacterium]
MLKKLLFLLCLCFALSQGAMAQSRTVTGTVTDQDSNPMVGVTVLLKGTTAGASTDLDGHYSLNVSDVKGATLTFSFIGMQTVEMPVGSKTVVDAQLSSDTQELEEVVVLGYGTVRKKEMTGAAAQVDSEALETTVSADLGTSLQGLVPGVSITASSGEPGATSNIQIRGVTSISDDANTPLYVVDGIPQEGDPQLSSNEIAQIDILKDAASCAIYGTRGAAGVILITTNQGDSSGKISVTFSGVYGVQQLNMSNLPDLMNTEEYAYMERVTCLADGTYFAALNSKIRTSGDNYVRDIDPYDILLSNNAPEQTYNINIVGGSGPLSFSAMGGYYNQAGLLPNAAFDRFNFRTNMSYKADKFTLTLGSNMMFSEKYAASGSSITTAISVNTYAPVVDASTTEYYTTDTSWATVNGAKTMLKLLCGYNNTKTDQAALNVGFDYKLTPNLTFNSKFGYGYTATLLTKMVPNVTIYDATTGEVEDDGFSNSSITSTSTRKTNLSATGGLTFNKQFGSGHKITAMGMLSYEEYTFSGYTASMKGLDAGSELYVLDAAHYSASASSSDSYTNKLFGAVARVMYDYKSRYLLSVSGRADASSRFLADNRWGFFPSASVGWNVADERFFSSLKKTMNGFKVRASFGTTGNQNITPYSYDSYVVSGYDYAFGSYGNEDLEYGMVQQEFANPDLKWETSRQINIGVDLAFLKNKFTVSADVYQTNKRDMLASVTIPSSAGGGSSYSKLYQNIGDMTNKGAELSVTYRYVKKGGLTFIASANAAKNINEITNLGEGNTIMYTSTGAQTAYAVGYEAGAFFLYKTAGIAKEDDGTLAAYQKLDANAEAGDLIHVDVDGDGDIDEDDRVYCGSGMASFEGGLNLTFRWKGFDLISTWYGSYGNEIINGTLQSAYSGGREVTLLSSYTSVNTASEVPANRSGNFDSDTDVWVEDGSYLRMKVLTLGYTFSNLNLANSKKSSLRIYFTGQNLLTFTRYSGLDPEVGGNGLSTRGIDNGTYPVSRKLMVGAKLTF